ncbi:odorant receptor coreceptor-like [Leptopilina boulardi]|uniref:odorant receptor coreceptor-like n=1 Tax=Leptopilina boulardi TaxID=63433 RepID=UPI0021F56216|nr:odorant receptor coreceptor-like [Leptopilina boulardi]
MCIKKFTLHSSSFSIFLRHFYRQRLQNIDADNTIFVQQNANKNQDKSCTDATECVKIHNIIIEFVDQLNSTFSVGLLLSITLFTVVLSFSSFVAHDYRHTSNVMITFLVLTLAEIFQLFNKFLQCQTLIDHSILFRKSIYDANWYNASSKTKTILYLMLIRSQKMCKITGGKFFDMSFNTFARILINAASYFTVISSVKSL